MTEQPDPKPTYLGHRQRLRDRFLKTGFTGFGDYEVVELLLTLAIPRRDVKPAAKALISKFGSVRGVLDAPVEELRRIEGLGEVAPVALRIVRETASLYLQQTAEGAEPLKDPEALVRFWRSRIGALPYEVFEVAYLDSAGRLLCDGVERLEEGTTDRASVYPRRVLEAALRRNAAAIVVAHNHPNGEVTPSEQDKLLTRALSLAAGTVSVRLLEHLVVSPDKVFSFREAGLL
ncbi:MAG: JAB domain-containing protein [Thermoanaerobaculia bacterium]